jgi:transposase-like protein
MATTKFKIRGMRRISIPASSATIGCNIAALRVKVIGLAPCSLVRSQIHPIYRTVLRHRIPRSTSFGTKRVAGEFVERERRGVAARAASAPHDPVLPAATGVELGAFLKANVAAGFHLLTDGFAAYRGRDAALGEHLTHTPVVQDESANAGEFFPIIHTLFSNIKAWLVGTHHGVSAKHLPRYLREWSYRFNRRNLPDGLDGYLIRRAVECATITPMEAGGSTGLPGFRSGPAD